MKNIERARELLGDQYVIVPISNYNRDSELIEELKKENARLRVVEQAYEAWKKAK